MNDSRVLEELNPIGHLCNHVNWQGEDHGKAEAESPGCLLSSRQLS